MASAIRLAALSVMLAPMVACGGGAGGGVVLPPAPAALLSRAGGALTAMGTSGCASISSRATATGSKWCLGALFFRTSWGYVVEWRRIELPTFALRTRRSPS
jgi:hypothetical protein